MFYFFALLTLLFLLIADDINYDVRFTAKTWSADLADKQSQGFKDFKDKIVQDVSSGFFFWFKINTASRCWGEMYALMTPYERFIRA